MPNSVIEEKDVAINHSVHYIFDTKNIAQLYQKKHFEEGKMDKRSFVDVDNTDVLWCNVMT